MLLTFAKGLRVIFRSFCVSLVISYLIVAGVFTVLVYNDVQTIHAEIQDVYTTQAILYTTLWKQHQIQIAVTEGTVDQLRQEVQQVVDSSVRPAYDYLKSVTVRIISRESMESNMGAIGTGIVIKITEDHTYILTNKHVCDMPICYVSDPNTKTNYQIQIVKRSETLHDMQVVRVIGHLPGKVAVPGIKGVTYQDKVYVVGQYLSEYFFYSEGFVAGFSRERGDLVVGAPMAPGNSGSGIITQDGYLSGLLYAGRLLNGQMIMTHAYCVNADVLQLFLAEYL